MTKVLTQLQAEAVYSAMRAMNSVGATIKANIPPAEEGGRWVSETPGWMLGKALQLPKGCSAFFDAVTGHLG